MSIKGYLDALTVPPWGGVPSNAEAYLAEHTVINRFWQRLKRDLLLLLTGQLFLKRASVPQTAKRVLYVYLGTPQLGDSIMDLSARQLWCRRGLIVDMFTHDSVVSFYKQDPTFHRITSDTRELDVQYDFVILQSYSAKCLKFKWRYFRLQPFLALHGHYYGCEFNRLEFSDGAWRHVLGLFDVSCKEVCSPVFNLRLSHARQARTPKKIAVAVGGVVAWRTYPHWAEVIRETSRKFPDLEWVLLGSANGQAIATTIKQEFEGLQNVVNQVDAISLDEIFQLLQRVSLLIAADGGLLNVGRAAHVPIVGLFAERIHPRMRFGAADAAHVIHAESTVAQIPPATIAKAIELHLKLTMTSLTVEYLGNEPNCTLV